MRVLVLGLRGFPGVEGGVEKHAENLYPILSRMGCDIDIVTRSQYQPSGIRHWKGVTFHRIWAPRVNGLEAFIHTFLGVLYAAVVRPDILHIHAIGPAIMTPLARILGLRVVVTHHGPDYDREKWGKGARALLRTGERWGMRFATQRIVISRVIQELVHKQCHQRSNIIPNGVNLPPIPTARDALKKFSIEKGRYVLIVSRLVPEKRHIDLIHAFLEAKLEGWKLVIVGTVDEQANYCKEVLATAHNCPDVVFAGFQSGDTLSQLYAHAGVFVLPSSHEGLPIALLEALSYGIPVLASDIPANVEVGLREEQYFQMGNIAELARSLRSVKEGEILFDSPVKIRDSIKDRYDWEKIAEATLAVYRGAMKQGHES